MELSQVSLLEHQLMYFSEYLDTIEKGGRIARRFTSAESSNGSINEIGQFLLRNRSIYRPSFMHLINHTL